MEYLKGLLFSPVVEIKNAERLNLSWWLHEIAARAQAYKNHSKNNGDRFTVRERIQAEMFINAFNGLNSLEYQMKTNVMCWDDFSTTINGDEDFNGIDLTITRVNEDVFIANFVWKTKLFQRNDRTLMCWWLCKIAKRARQVLNPFKYLITTTAKMRIQDNLVISAFEGEFQHVFSFDSDDGDSEDVDGEETIMDKAKFLKVITTDNDFIGIKCDEQSENNKIILLW